MNEPKLLKVTQVARLFNVSRPTVYRMVNAGQLEAFTINDSIRVPAEAVQRYLDEHRITGGESGSPIHVDTTKAAAPLPGKESDPDGAAQPPTQRPGLSPSAKVHGKTGKAELIARQKAEDGRPTAEMILERKAWKMARTLAVKLLPADADSARWDRTLKLAYEESRKRLLAASAGRSTPR